MSMTRAQLYRLMSIRVGPPTMTCANALAAFEAVVLGFTLTASSLSTFEIVGGTDAAQFQIVGNRLQWVGNGVQVWNNPNDSNRDNVYAVDVRAVRLADGVVGSPITISVTVTKTPYTYPAQVVAADLQATFDNKFFIKPRPKYTPALNKSLLNQIGATVSGNRVNISGLNGDQTYDDWDFSGYWVLVDKGPSTITFNRCYFFNDSYSRGVTNGGGLLGIGTTASNRRSGEVVVCNYCEFNGKGAQAYDGTKYSQEAVIKCYGNLTLNSCWHHDSPKDPFMFLGSSFSVNDCYINSPAKVGNGPSGNLQHVDVCHTYAGHSVYTRCYFDFYDAVDTGIAGGFTSSSFYPQGGTTDDVYITWDHCVHAVPASLNCDDGSKGATYMWQWATSTGKVSDITITHSLISRGTTNKFCNAPDIGCIMHDDHTNWDWYTGNPINHLSPPGPITIPNVTGTANVGDTLTCDTGTWRDDPTSFIFKWYRKVGTTAPAFIGVTSSTYMIQAIDVGTTITCQVTAFNDTGFSSLPISSNAINP